MNMIDQETDGSVSRQVHA